MVRRLHQALTQGAFAPAAMAVVVSATAWVAVALPSRPALAQSASGVVAYEGARLIPGDGRPPIERAVLLVEGGRIRQVGASGSVDVPAGAARVNLAGKTVIPALVNAHTHLELSWMRRQVAPAEDQQDLAIESAQPVQHSLRQRRRRRRGSKGGRRRAFAKRGNQQA